MAIDVLIADDRAFMRTMILKTMRMSGLPLGDTHQAASFIRKPFSPEIIRDTVKELLGEGAIGGSTT